MRRVQPGWLIAGVLAVAAIGLKIARPHGIEPPSAPFALTSAGMILPDDTATLPPGPQVDLVTARCTACHSAEMILTQPALSAEQWQATVTKMREVYRAPVPKSDDAAILAYLTGLSAARTSSKEPS